MLCGSLRWLLAACCSLSTVMIAYGCVGEDPDAVSPTSTQDGGSADGNNNDGNVDGSGSVDAGADAKGDAACDRALPFGIAEKLGPTINTSASEYSGRLSPDGQSILFMRDTMTAAGHDLFRAPRTPGVGSNDFTFGDAIAIQTANGLGLDGTPSIDGTGHLIWQVERASVTPGFGNFDIWWADPVDGGGFANPRLLAEVSSPDRESTSYAVRSGQALYFARKPNAGGTAKILVSYFAANMKAYEAPAPVMGLDDAMLDLGDPTVTSDELVIYFKRENPQSKKADIFRAERSAAVGAFDPAKAVTELNTTGNESPTWISDDECTIFLARAQAGEQADLYIAHRPR